MKVLVDEDQLRFAVSDLASEIAERYSDDWLTLIGMMSSSLMFLAELVRRLEMPLLVRMLQNTEQRWGQKPGPVTEWTNLDSAVRGRHILVVDDLLETGQTLFELVCQLDQMAPKSIRTAVLVRKILPDPPVIRPQHTLFELQDDFIVGYGLHYDGAYRNLPYLAALEPHERSCATYQTSALADSPRVPR